MEKMIREIQLLSNGGIPDEEGLLEVLQKDSGWPHFCALSRVVDVHATIEITLLENGGIPDGLDFQGGAIDQRIVDVPRPVVAWFALTSFLLAMAGNI